METATQLRQKRGHLVWLAAGALGASMVWAALTAGRGLAMPTRPKQDAAKSSELEKQVQRLEEQMSTLQDSVHAASARQAVHRADDEPLLAAEHGTANRADQEAEGTPPPSEERLSEQTEERISNRYAFLEQRFSGETVDTNRGRADEQSLRARVEKLDGYELLKVECRYTMCRLELKSEGKSAAGIMRLLGFTEGGEIRRRTDGTFLIFAGREGFPFQELNGPR